MPNKGDFTGNPDGARQYLANLIASDQWTAAKNLDDYKDDQIIRKANTFRQQEQAGVPISNKAARGHADIIPTRPTITPSGRQIPPTLSASTTPPAKPRKDITIFQAPRIPLHQQIQGPKGSSQYNTTRFSDVMRELKRIDRVKPGANVYFSLWDNRKGKYVKMYIEKGKIGKGGQGVNIRDIMSRVRSKVKNGESKTEREALLDVWDEDIEGGVAGDDTPDDVETPEVFTQIGIHVIGDW